MTWLYRLLPALAGAGRRTRAVGCAAVGATTAGLAAHALVTAAGAGGTSAARLLPALCYLGALVLLVLRAATATHDRHGWRALALAAGVWLAGTAVATFAGHVRPVEHDFTGGGNLDPVYAAEQRGLSGAARADHHDDLALRHRQIDAVDHRDVAEHLGQTVDRQQRCRHHASFFSTNSENHASTEIITR